MPELAPPPKFIFKSKTAIASLLTVLAGVVGNFSPDLQTFLSTHATTILLAIGGLNLVLRLVTKGRVSLIPD